MLPAQAEKSAALGPAGAATCAASFGKRGDDGGSMYFCLALQMASLLLSTERSRFPALVLGHSTVHFPTQLSASFGSTATSFAKTVIHTTLPFRMLNTSVELNKIEKSLSLSDTQQSTAAEP